MNPGDLFVRSWIPHDTNVSFPDTLTLYDAGNIQGWLIKTSSGNTSWTVFQIDVRMQEKEDVWESGEIVDQSSAPLHYISITHYPLRQERLGPSHLLFSLPGQRILLTVSPSSPLEQAPQPPLPLLPQRPSPRPGQGGAGPGSREPRKSDSSKPTGGLRPSQSKSKTSPTGKALSSSNQGHRAQPLSQAPTTQEEHPQLHSPKHRSDHESSESPPWTSLAQQSLYSRPPPELVKELAEQV